MASEVPEGGIILAPDWKLVPLDERNWELCHRYATEARGARPASNGPVWHRCGRFYSYNTIGEALLYVADNLLKAKAHGRHMELQDAIHEYRAIAESLRQAVSAR